MSSILVSLPEELGRPTYRLEKPGSDEDTNVAAEKGSEYDKPRYDMIYYV